MMPAPSIYVTIQTMPETFTLAHDPDGITLTFEMKPGDVARGLAKELIFSGLRLLGVSHETADAEANALAAKFPQP